MGTRTDLDPKQLNRVQKLITRRTQKNAKITQQEAAQKLEPQLRQALKNGYSARELSRILKDANFPIPANLIRELETGLREAEKCDGETSEDASSL